MKKSVLTQNLSKTLLLLLAVFTLVSCTKSKFEQQVEDLSKSSCTYLIDGSGLVESYECSGTSVTVKISYRPEMAVLLMGAANSDDFEDQMFAQGGILASFYKNEKGKQLIDLINKEGGSITFNVRDSSNSSITKDITVESELLKRVDSTFGK